MKPKTLFPILSLVIFLLLAVVLVYEASMPGEISSEHSGAVSNVIQDATEKVESVVGGGGENSLSEKITTNWSEFAYMVRKGIGHFGAFLALAVFGTYALINLAPNKASGGLVALLLGVIIATLTEYIQLHVKGRYGSFDDVMLDSFGYAIGFVITIVIALIIYLIGIHRYKKQ
ncbi:MAG: VanZ family protein [Clostridia bacterium]|nr:VanZ family protein [Clostridia bacterium]